METIENTRFYCRVIQSLPVSEQQNIIAISPWQQITDWLSTQAGQHAILGISGEIDIPSPHAFQHHKPTIYYRIERDIRISCEFLIQEMPFERCWNLYFYLLLQLMNKPELRALTKMILCSGNGLAEKPAALFCQQHNIVTRYTELANFLNKVFIDPEGANALSALAKNPSCLDALPAVSDEFHAEWMAYYETEKRQPPLQVSYNTQLWLNADLRNKEAILHGCRAARQEKRELVVKIHPAETAPDELLDIARLQQQHNFIITQENTLDLIKASGRVLTINSTVGIEAQLYHKPVEILGRAFYKHFDHERLKKYLHHYLFTSVEVRAQTPIAEATARAFIRH